MCPDTVDNAVRAESLTAEAQGSLCAEKRYGSFPEPAVSHPDVTQIVRAVSPL